MISDNGPDSQVGNSPTSQEAMDLFTRLSALIFHKVIDKQNAEIQTVKNLLKKATDPYKAMLVYRNTTLEDLGLSPAQL